MACRVAGGNDSPEKLWDFLMNKKDASGEIPDIRWEPYRRRDARNAKELDKTTSRGYFLDKLEDFDSTFFGISPREAEMMDPQQRISLEVTWEALESAGIPPQSLAGSETAVFMGVNSDDYSKLLLEDLPNVEAWMGIGTAFCGIPNRISYHLDLMGPSTAVDAACASSLVAIHHGRQALIEGETNLAIVGGVNAMCGPGLTKVLDKAGAISPEGFCRSFDEDAKGYGRGEGTAVIILKRMDDALNDNDNILAVLKGSAVAQDGRTNGIMAPNAKAQELVARNALRVAGVDPDTIGYVEAHATSTPVGDPVEISAVSNVYGRGRASDKPCLLGSIKPNIGHLEAGAGAMGFIKAVMAVNKGIIPPQANLHKLNSKINWQEAGVQVVQQPTKFPLFNVLRRAGICSYGYGGTVSHAVVEEYPGNSKAFPAPGTRDDRTKKLNILLLSAPQEKRLAGQAEALKSWILTGGSKQALASISNTLATRRGHHDYRAAFVVESHEDAAASLKAFSEGAGNAATASSRVLDSKANKEAVWVFSGHGAQWKEMGREMLLDPVFHEVVASIEQIVKTEMGFSALQALQVGDFESSDRVQVITYVMQIGLAAVLYAKGVVPGAVIGHSVGEIAASVVAGALTSSEGAIVVCRRAVLYRKMMGQGSMVLVNQPYADVEKEIGSREDVAVAIDSSPSSCVVSGAVNVVTELAESWKARGIQVFRVKTDIAFHSPVLNKLVAPLRQSLARSLLPRAPLIKLYSTSLKDPRAQDFRDIQYFANNMTNPVLLTQAITAAAEDGYRIFLEVSSHPIISQSITETLMDKEIEDQAVLPTLLRGKPAEKCIASSVAQLHCKGTAINWKSQMGDDWVPDVPRTIWNHQPCWRKIETGPLNSANTHDVDTHNLLGQRIPMSGENMTVFTTRLEESTKPFPGNHPLHGTEIIPAAVLINTFFHGTGTKILSDIVLRVPVAISAPRDLQLTAQAGQVRLTSRLIQSDKQDSDDLSWVTHTTGHFDIDDDLARRSSAGFVDVAAAKARIGTQLDNNFSIEYLDKVGVSAMGFPWAVTEHFGNVKEMIARVDVAPDVAVGAPLPWDARSWAPIFDAATSIGSTLFFNEPRLRMPAQVGQVNKYSDEPPPKIGYIYVREATESALAVHVEVLDESGKILASIESMRFAEIEGTPGVSGSVESLVHQLAWPPACLAEEPLLIGNMIIISKSSDITDKYRGYLKSYAGPVSKYSSIQELAAATKPFSNDQKQTIIIYAPTQVNSLDDIHEASKVFCEELLDIVKFVANRALPIKVFALTQGVHKAETPTALAQAPLHGLARIIASEQADLWGALIDTEDSTFPLQAIKYVEGADVIRIDDGIARTARLRAIPRNKLLPKTSQANLLPRPEGTYLISGGLGALGIEVAHFLVEKGARRLVLLSRRALPSRKEWKTVTGAQAEAIRAIEHLESRGATIHTISIDLGAQGAEQTLQASLDRLSLPPVLGVVHAAGVLEDQLILESTADSFSRVLAPKIAGALTLHRLFPANSLNFFILFSSCGQLFGFPGQGSYASGNAFLDTLAAHRRRLGDNSIAFQWTAWRGLGMGASTDFINAELESKGITDVTRDEAFRAWDHLVKYDTDHGVVLRSLAFDEGEPLPVPILNDIAVRRPASGSTGGGDDVAAAAADARAEMPTSGVGLKEYLGRKIRECVMKVLQLPSIDDVEPRAALSDLGMDSVMTVGLRKLLQQALKVKVPPTLTWSHPTVAHLQAWFVEKLQS